MAVEFTSQLPLKIFSLYCFRFSFTTLTGNLKHPVVFTLRVHVQKGHVDQFPLQVTPAVI